MKQKKQGGITLIALVITITVLLILAGIPIAMITGENGILRKATEAKIESAHGEVKEAVELEAQAYYAEKIAGDYEGELLKYLEEKGIIDENGVIDILTLRGVKLITGNGADGKDIYTLEEYLPTEASITKLASTETVKIAAAETSTAKLYKIMYYDESGEERKLGILSEYLLSGKDDGLYHFKVDGEDFMCNPGDTWQKFIDDGVFSNSNFSIHDWGSGVVDVSYKGKVIFNKEGWGISPYAKIIDGYEYSTYTVGT